VQDAVGSFTVHLRLHAPTAEGVAERIEREVSA
jgi:hypothetical protein